MSQFHGKCIFHVPGCLWPLVPRVGMQPPRPLQGAWLGFQNHSIRSTCLRWQEHPGPFQGPLELLFTELWVDNWLARTLSQLKKLSGLLVPPSKEMFLFCDNFTILFHSQTESWLWERDKNSSECLGWRKKLPWAASSDLYYLSSHPLLNSVSFSSVLTQTTMILSVISSLQISNLIGLFLVFISFLTSLFSLKYFFLVWTLPLFLQIFLFLLGVLHSLSTWFLFF